MNTRATKPCFLVRSCGRLALSLLILSLADARAKAQSSSLLQIESLNVTAGNPIDFTFSDQGTGATNYQVEFSEVVGPSASWAVVASATITDLGGGRFRAVAPDSQTDHGYYRVRALGGTATVTASFNAAALQVTEGGMVSPVITFDAPFTGVVRYSISGTVTSGDYLNLTGEVTVNGTSASIPVTFTDNNRIGQLKYLTLTLEAGEGYSIGAGGTTTITVDENDADWQGTFHTRGANLGFVLSIEQLNGASMATLRSDELGLFPTNETSVAVTLSSDEFQVDTAAIPLEGQATPFGAPAQLLFHLEASNAMTNQTVSPTAVEGTGFLVSQYAGQPHLTTTNFGTFTLLKRALAPSTNQVHLVDLY